MVKSTKRLLVSLLCCFGSVLGWGFQSFTVNLRAYRDKNHGAKQNQPMAISLIFAAIGIIISNFIFLIVWPQRPFNWIKPVSAGWSVISGFLYSLAMYQYIVAADEAVPANIGGPVAGLHVLVPPLWHVIFFRKCLGVKTIIGFILSLLSLFIFSGLLSESGSFTISTREWVALLLTILGFGVGLIIQDKAGEDVTIYQFPQLFTWLTIGYAGGLCIFACAGGNVSDITDRSYWVPFGVEQILSISPTLSAGLGTGFFSLCLMYAEDLNVMVALSSLNIVIPAILGILILKEPATWNVLLGLVLVLVAMIILSFEAIEVINSPSLIPRRPSFSESSIYLVKIQNVDKTPYVI